MKFILTTALLSLSLTAGATQLQCTAYCLDVVSQKNPKTQQVEHHFNRSPLIKSTSYQGLVSKCQANFGNALLLGFQFQKSRNSSKLTNYKLAKAQTACKSI